MTSIRYIDGDEQSCHCPFRTRKWCFLFMPRYWNSLGLDILDAGACDFRDHKSTSILRKVVVGLPGL